MGEFSAWSARSTFLHSLDPERTFGLMLISRLSGVECAQGSRAKSGSAVSGFWDKDIANLDMSEEEKNGLQVFRDYKPSFDDHAEKSFTEEIDGESFDVEHLERGLGLMTDEDARFLPVIACAYADDLLEAMFKAEMPDDVPGGKSALSALTAHYLAFSNGSNWPLCLTCCRRIWCETLTG